MKYLSIAATVLSLAIGFGSANAAPPFAQPQAEPTAHSLLTHVQWEGRYCRQLRYACVYKHRLGEEGEGNCRRYRQECGGYGSYGGYGRGGNGYGEGREDCESLRNACIYKESRGEVGEGNCRRYREQCR